MKENDKRFLEYFASKFPIFHLSNVFFLDVKYAFKSFLLTNKRRVSDEELESLTKAFINEMVSEGVMKQVSGGTWTLFYPDFRTKTPGKPQLN